MNATTTTIPAPTQVFCCPDCLRWFFGNGQYARGSVDTTGYERCPECELDDQAVALETERQRLDIERELALTRRLHFWRGTLQ